MGENKKKSRIKTSLLPMRHFWQTLANTIENSEASPADKIRLKNFFVFLLLGMPTMMIFGGYNFFQGKSGLPTIAFLAVLCLSSCGFILLRYPTSKSIYRFCWIIYSGLLIYLLTLGGEGGSKALWLYTFPLIVMFLMGMKEGLAWSIAILVIAVVLLSLPLPFLTIYPYPGEFIVRFLVSYLIITAITYWFEYFRYNYYQQLREGHRRFEEILENSRDILYRRDIQTGEYHYISKAFCDHLGYSRAEMKALAYAGVEDLIHPEDREKHSLSINNLSSTSSQSPHSCVVEFRMRHKDGTYLWFSDQIVLLHDAGGKSAFVIGSNREITDLRQARMELKDARDQLIAILNSIDASVYVADMESYEIIFMNNKMKQDFGWDIEGEICWREFRAEKAPCKNCTNKKLLDSRGIATGLIEWEGQNPLTKKWYINYDRAIQWIDGRWVRLQIAVDITQTKLLEEERKNNEAALRRTAHLEAIGNLAGGIAHDFNNLLQVQLGNISLIEDEELSPDTRDELKEIESVAYKALGLSNRLITFAAGGTPLRNAMDISSLLQDVVAELADVKNSTFNLSLQADLWQVPFDYNQMMIVVKNLIENGCDSMPEGGQLAISANNVAHTGDSGEMDNPVMPPGRYVRIRIQDDGCGIDEVSLPKIFDPYYSTKSKGHHKGVGLGLSIAYSIISRHDGHITVQSELGKGTTVDIILPVAKENQGCYGADPEVSSV